MAKNISLMGASYTDVPAVTLPQTGGGTARFDDASVTTATASDVAQGKVFLASDGTITTGTGGGGELSDDVKTALLNCFQHVAWIDDQGQTYYDALYDALHGGVASISAVYTQTMTVYTTDSLDVLRSDLVVTATYNDGTTRTVTGYVLSGTLTEGTSTVTVAYQGVTDTFNVAVTDLAYITAVFTQPQTTIYTDDSLDSLKSYLVVTYYTAPGATGTVLASSAYTLVGALTEGTSVITAEYLGLTDTFNVTNVADYLKRTSYVYPGDPTLYMLNNYQGDFLTIDNMRKFVLTPITMRCALQCTHGNRKAMYEDGSDADGFYIPVPVGKTSVTINVQPSTIYMYLSLCVYYDNPNRFYRRGDSGGWVQSGFQFTFGASDAVRYLCINFKNGTNGTTQPNVTNLEITFS